VFVIGFTYIPVVGHDADALTVVVVLKDSNEAVDQTVVGRVKGDVLTLDVKTIAVLLGDDDSVDLEVDSDVGIGLVTLVTVLEAVLAKASDRLKVMLEDTNIDGTIIEGDSLEDRLETGGAVTLPSAEDGTKEVLEISLGGCEVGSRDVMHRDELLHDASELASLGSSKVLGNLDEFIGSTYKGIVTTMKQINKLKGVARGRQVVGVEDTHHVLDGDVVRLLGGKNRRVSISGSHDEGDDLEVVN
jgi:hypothetical protein